MHNNYYTQYYNYIFIADSPSSENAIVSPCKKSDFWIDLEELNLYPSDHHIVLSSVQWLNDNIINAAQTLLHPITSSVAGFQNTQLGKNLKFKPVTQNFIQILHINSSHWITISTIGCQKGEVIVYDSRYSSLTLKTKLQIACIMKGFNLMTLKFLIANSHQQNDSCSCGLFAIAAATELSHGSDPCLCHWHVPSMRQHLLACLENGSMVPFPRDDQRAREKQDRYLAIIEEPVYCVCQQVNDTNRAMVCCVSCGLWYHGLYGD